MTTVLHQHLRRGVGEAGKHVHEAVTSDVGDGQRPDRLVEHGAGEATGGGEVLEHVSAEAVTEEFDE